MSNPIRPNIPFTRPPKPAVVNTVGRQPVIPTKGTGLNGGNVPRTSSAHVVNPYQRKT